MSKRLFNLVTDHTFPTAQAAGVSSIASSFIKTAANSAGVGSALTRERDPTREVLNCLRVLQRVLPVVFDGDFEALENKVLWEREELQEGSNGSGGPKTDAADDQPQFVIEDDDDEDEPTSPARRMPASPSSRHKTSATVTPEAKAKTLPPLAERLISCAIDLLFCCGFTLPKKIQVDHYKINYVIW